MGKVERYNKVQPFSTYFTDTLFGQILAIMKTLTETALIG